LNDFVESACVCSVTCGNNGSVVVVQRKDAPLFTCQEEVGGDASFGLVSRVSSLSNFYAGFFQ